MTKKPPAGQDPPGPPWNRDASFGALVEQYWAPILRYLAQQMRDNDLADEVRQQVFLEAHRDLARRQPENLKSWLYGIARHRALDELKRKKRWFTRFKNDEVTEAVDPDPPVTEWTHDLAILAKALESCLGKLSPPVRETVLLRFQQELSFEELSEMTGEQAGTLQRRVLRAFPELRKCIERKMKGGLR